MTDFDIHMTGNGISKSMKKSKEKMNKKTKKKIPSPKTFSEFLKLVLKQMIFPIQKLAEDFHLKLTYTIEPMKEVLKKGEIYCWGCSTPIKYKKAVACPDCEAALCSSCHKSPDSHECEESDETFSED